MATNLGTAIGYLTLDITGFTRGIDDATRQLDRMGTNSTSTLDKMGTAFTKTGTILTATVTAPIVGFGSSILREGTTFEEAMTQVKNVANLANSDIDEFRKAVSSLGFQMTETGDDAESMYKTMYNYAINQGSETRYTAEEVAQALYYMGLAGWEAQDMMYGLRPVLDLAAATGEDLARVSDIVTDSMTALQVPVEDLASYTNVLAEMTRNSNTTLDQAGEAFKYVAPMAGSLGYTYQDLATAIGLFANVGVKGSQAGTGLRQALNSLTNPSEKALEAMDAYNISLYDGYGNAKSLADVMVLLRDRFQMGEDELESFNQSWKVFENNINWDEFEKLSEDQQLEKFMNFVADDEDLQNHPYFKGWLTDMEKMSAVIRLVGIRALPGVLGIINSSEEDFNSLVNSINSADEAYGGIGASAGMAAELMNTTQGSIYKLTSSISELKIQLFELLGGPFKDLVDDLTSVVKWFNSLDKSTQETFVHIAEAAMLIGPALLVLGKITPIISGIGTAISGLKGMFGTAGLASIFSNMSPIDEFGNAVELIGDDFVEAGLKKDGFADNVTGTLNPALGQGTTAAGKFAGAGGLGGILKMLGGIAAVIGGAILAIGSFVDAWQKGWDILHAILIGLGLALAAVGAVILGAPAAVAAIVAAVIFVIANAVLLIKDHWEEIKALLAEAVEAVKACFKKIYDDVAEIITGFGSLFAGVIEDITWFVFEFIPDIISTIFTAVSDFYISIYTSAAEFGVKIGQAIGEWLKSIIKNIKETLSNIVSTLKENLANMWGNISSWFTNLINNVAQWFNTLINNITDWFTNLISNTTQWFETLFSNITGWLSNLWDNITNWFTNLVSNVTKWFDDIMSHLSTLVEKVLGLIKSAGETIMNGISNVFDTISSGIETLSGFFISIFTSLMENVKSALSSIASAISEFISGVVSTVSELISTIMEFVGGLASFIGSALMDILSAMKGFFDSFIAELGSTLDGIGSWVGGVISQLSEFISGLWDNLTSMVSEFGSGMAEMLTSIGSGITELVSTAGKGLTDFLSSIGDSISGGISSVINSLSNGFSGLWGSIVDIGRNIVMGIWEGIKAGASWVANNVGEACNNILNGIKNAFQIGSPSKVMADEVGRWLPPGIVDGFDDAIPDAEDDINDSLDDLIEGIGAKDSMFNIGTSYSDLQTVMSDSYTAFADSVETTEQRLNASLDSMFEKMYNLVLLEQQLNDGIIGSTGYGTPASMIGGQGGINNTNNTGNGNTFIFNSPKAIDEIEAARQMEKTQREMQEGFI